MNLDVFVDQDGNARERERELDIGGNKIYFRYTDPYGFISLAIDKGQLPTYLKQASFTSFDQALVAVKNYLNNKKKE
jgi:hypothetical protein